MADPGESLTAIPNVFFSGGIWCMSTGVKETKQYCGHLYNRFIVVTSLVCFNALRI